MRRTPLARTTPLRPGTKGLKRGGPPRRKTGVKPRNAKRLARLRAVQFAEQAAICRELACAFCGHPPPSVPHHVVRRGMGGTGGTDADTVPCCDDCHREIHQHGDSARPVEHGALSSLIHNLMSLLAERPEEIEP